MAAVRGSALPTEGPTPACTHARRGAPNVGTVQNVDQIPQYADERLTAELEGRCLHCEKAFGDDIVRSVDHCPSKTLLLKPYPTNLPTVPACVKCNNGFSDDEQYVRMFLECVIAGSADPDAQPDSGVRTALVRATGLRAEIEAAMREPLFPGHPMMWVPDHRRMSNVLTKNARGHLWYEHAAHRPDPPSVGYAALESLNDEQREAFENPPDVSAVLPEVGTRALARVFSGDTFAGWTFVQDGRYRFAIDHLGNGAVRVRSIISEYLATEVLWSDE